MSKGLFVSIEGIEGAGKSTLISRLKEVKSFTSEVVFTREPGGVDIAEQIRELLVLRENNHMDAITELLLVYASRNEHINKVIQPALAEGKIVISDRYFDASYAYQGGGRHVDQKILQILDDIVVKSYIPNLTILMKAPIELCLDRVNSRGNQDRFDDESATFFTAAQSVYMQRAQDNPSRFMVVDSTDPLEDYLEKCIQAINTRVA